MKQLHEKKISELGGKYHYHDCVEKKDFKQWAIAIVKDIKMRLGEYKKYCNKHKRRSMSVGWDKFFPDIEYDDEYLWHEEIIKYQMRIFIDRFEIAEEDLK